MFQRWIRWSNDNWLVIVIVQPLTLSILTKVVAPFWVMLSRGTFDVSTNPFSSNWNIYWRRHRHLRRRRRRRRQLKATFFWGQFLIHLKLLLTDSSIANFARVESSVVEHTPHDRGFESRQVVAFSKVVLVAESSLCLENRIDDQSWSQCYQE